MVIDRDGRILGKINLIDFLIVAGLVAAAVFAFARFSRGGGEIVPAAASKEYELKFFVEKVEDFVVNGVSVGDNIYDDSKNMLLGEIIMVDIGEGIDYNPDKNGKLVKSSREGYSSMEITSVVSAVPFENGITVSGNKYGVGHSLTIRAGQSVCFMRISGLEEK